MAKYDTGEATQAQMRTERQHHRSTPPAPPKSSTATWARARIDTDRATSPSSGKDSVYVDSDLHIGGDLSLNSDGEIVLDLSNMGDYRNDAGGEEGPSA